ncbi:hypothetical protein DSO57_1003064 [Entomophthora muscae]|uniref:Uncharacterized protein n=1 Tax=Entomophthora muscae TaxID=34485 RepID=A0ACC2TK92_9FUNG|nr:hypothetical protein DSO57_1003064 [Entomophthora muscae]
MQLSYISFLAFSLHTVHADTINLKDFKKVSKRTVRGYLGQVKATKTMCNNDLTLNINGTKECYAIKAGSQPQEQGIFTDNLSNPPKKTSVDFVLHLSTTKKLTGDQLKESNPDFVLFTSEIDPDCQLIEFAQQRLGPTIFSGASYTVSESNGETSATTHRTKTSIGYETPKFIPIGVSVEAKAEYTTSTEEVTRSNIGKTFESQRDSPCTPYAISYALSCQYTNHRKVLFQDGEVIGNFLINQPLKGEHFIPNPYDNEFVSQVTGCVALGRSK